MCRAARNHKSWKEGSKTKTPRPALDAERGGCGAAGSGLKAAIQSILSVLQLDGIDIDQVQYHIEQFLYAIHGITPDMLFRGSLPVTIQYRFGVHCSVTCITVAGRRRHSFGLFRKARQPDASRGGADRSAAPPRANICSCFCLSYRDFFASLS